MKEWLAHLNDPHRDIYERRYRLLSAISIVVLAIWLAVASAVSFHPTRFAFFATCDLLFIPIMVFTLRTGRIQLGAGVSAVGLVFLMLPFAFIYNGGIEAGAPNWFLIALVFITLTVRGRLRLFLLISDIAVTAACYVLVYHRPDLVVPCSVGVTYVDSLASIIITGVFVSSMFLFQLYVSAQERAILENQQREIEELNRAQKSFFSSMSHEIRTPVNTIIGLNEMILRQPLSAEVLEDAQNIEAASRLLLQTVNDILEMSKLESGQLTIVEDRYNTGDMLSDIVNMIWVKAREKGLEFRVEVDPGMPSALIGDEMRVKQVLLNVLTNAVKYTERGSVTLSIQGEQLEDGQARVVYSVADTGIGIRKESLPHLFTAFKRVDEQDNRHIEGTGLGLSIVKQLLDRMGGTISVNSIYTKGSTFIIELPQRIADDQPVGHLDMRYGREVRSKSVYQPSFVAPEARVLAVDDTPANLLVVEKLLRDTQVVIDTASSGEQALQRTQEHRYDVILMDHLMSGMDGVECLRRIRTQLGGLCQKSRVVALTANAGSDMEAFYRREGFDGYLVKPVYGEVLERELLRLLPEELVRLERRVGAEGTDRRSAGDYRGKKPVLITVDSSCDLPEDLLRELEIALIPFYVQTENALFLDGVEVETRGLIAYMERGGNIQAVPPKTAEFEAFFADHLLRANHIIHITAAQSVSKGYPAAVAAAETFDNVTVYDGGHLSSGTGLLAIYAARMARNGQSVEAIIETLDGLRKEISTSFVIESVDYLVRAGRTGRGVKLVSDALMLHPEFQMIKGRLRTVRLFWGSRERIQRKYIASVFRRYLPADRELLFLTHVGLSAEDCQKIAKAAQETGGFQRVIVQNASAAISANCGPGTFGLLYRARVVDLGDWK